MPDDPRHLRISEIFQAAVELEGDARERFLRTACGSDQALLSDVRSLLDRDAPEPVHLFVNDADSTAPMPPGEVTPTPDSPQTFGPYQILERAGEGAMGIVWRAWEPRLERHVALKFLPQHMADDPAARARFLREGKNASRLKHPGIATVYGAGEIDGRAYIAFEFVDGHSLTHLLRSGPFAAADAVRTIIAAARALDHAHRRSVFHRDISSNNIMITRERDVIVVDFGLAISEGAEKITRSGITGTVAFMSPEAVDGIDELDYRMHELADTWGLAVVLYHLLTGSLPFRAPTIHKLMSAILDSEPLRPSQIVSILPPEVDDVLTRALQKDPDKRYQNASEFAAALEELLRSATLPESPPEKAMVRLPDPTATPLSTSRRRRQRRIVFVSAFVVVAIGTGVTWKNQLGTAPMAPTAHALAIIDFREAEAPQQQNLSAGLTGLLQIGLIENAPCRVVSTEYLYDLRRRLFGSSTGPITPEQALEVARKSGADVLLTGQCASEGAGYYVAWQLVDTRDGAGLGARRVEGGAMTSLADDVMGGVLPLLASRCGEKNASRQTPVANLTTSSADAYKHYVAGLADLDRLKRDAAIQEFKAAVGTDSTFALGWFGLARAYGGHHDSVNREGGKPGCSAGERAWGLRSRLGIKDRMLLEAWLNRTCRDDMVGAIETHRELVARWPDDRDAAYHLIEMLMWIHMGGEAVPTVHSALGRYPSDLKLKEISAIALQSSGRLREAISLHKQVAAAASDNPNNWDNIGGDYIGLGLPDSADVEFHKALAIDPDFIESRINLAMSPFYRGETRTAIDGLRRLESPDLTEEVRRELANYISQLLSERGQFARAFLEFNSQPPPYDPIGVGLANYENFLLSPDLRRRTEIVNVLKKALERRTQAQTPYEEIIACWGVVTSALLADSMGLARPSFQRTQQLIGSAFPRNAYWWITCAEFSLADGRPTDALGYLGNVEKTAIWPGDILDIRRRTYLACAHRALGQYSEAVANLKELKRLYPGHYLADYELARVDDEMKRPADAIASYGKFLEEWSDADPGLVQVQHARERLLALKRAP